VLADHVLGDAADDDCLTLRVDAFAAHGLAHQHVELVDQLGLLVTLDSRRRHADPSRDELQVGR
jgi:hypothetical protein